MLADWSKLDREVACINNRLDLCRRVEALREVSVSLFLCLFWCLFPTLVFSVCACRHANRRQRRREGHERQTETVWGWFWLGSIGAFTLCFVGKSSTGVTNNPPFLSSSTEMHTLRHKYTHAQPNWVFYWALPCSALPLSVDSAFIQ